MNSAEPVGDRERDGVRSGGLVRMIGRRADRTAGITKHPGIAQRIALRIRGSCAVEQNGVSDTGGVRTSGIRSRRLIWIDNSYAIACGVPRVIQRAYHDDVGTLCERDDAAKHRA